MRCQVEKATPTKSSQSIVDESIEEILSYGIENERIKKYGDNHRVRFAYDLDYSKNYLDSGAKVLDCGAWPFFSTLAHAKLGYQMFALDADASRLGDIISQIDIAPTTCNIETDSIPFEDFYFDAILFNEVFEHMRINLIFTMSELFRVLKPGGVLFLSTPNIRSVGGIYNLLVRDLCYSSTPSVYDQFEKLNSLGHMGHMREYTATETIDFLARIGFQTEGIIWRGEYSGKKGIIAKLFPHLRKRFTVVARKPPSLK